jgi:hypothetical protein
MQKAIEGYSSRALEVLLGRCEGVIYYNNNEEEDEITDSSNLSSTYASVWCLYLQASTFLYSYSTLSTMTGPQ